ncbi:MAG: hypothetical protein JXL97_05090 [Bacteroidales bacterium]|nr:hypothetical protein [Bacteroidales bacterium]
MKKTFFLFIVSLSIIFFECNNKQQNIIIYEFSYIKDIEIPIENNFYKNPFYYKYINNDTGFYFMYFCREHLFLYDINKEILLNDLFLPNTLFVEIINSDSIFIQQRSNKNFSYHNKDSMLLLIDIKGNIKNNYSFFGAPVIGGQYNKKDSLSASNLQRIFFKNQKLYLFFCKLYYDNLNDSAFRSVDNIIVGHIDLTDNKFYPDSAIKYPDLPKEKILDKSYSQIYPYFTEDYLFCSFGYTTKTLKYNLETQQIDTINANSYFLKDFEITTESKAFVNSPVHLYFDYCQKTQEYLSYFLLNSISEGLKFNVVILDTNFNRIGEYVSDLYITDNNYIDGYYYFFNNKKTMNADKKIIISVYSLERKMVPLNSIESTKPSNKDNKCNLVTKNNIDSIYLQNYLVTKVGKSDFKAIIVPVFMSCHSCVDFILQSYSINQNFYKNNNVYLIAVGEDFFAIKEKLNQFNIYVDSETIIIDSSSNYFNAYKEFSLEHLVIIKNKTLIFADDYYPDELDSLVMKTFE